MSTKLNLSSNPFRNRVLPWTVTTLITVVSIFALIFIAKLTVQKRGEVMAVERDVARLHEQTKAINQKANEIKIALTPEQKRTLTSAHTLADRKQFSWTRLFADLESALPGNVRVVRIIVKGVGKEDGRAFADLALTVASKNPTTITDMIEGMQREGVFQAQLVMQSLQRGRGESGAEYEMNVHYVPRAGVPMENNEGNTRPVDTATSNGRVQ